MAEKERTPSQFLEYLSHAGKIDVQELTPEEQDSGPTRSFLVEVEAEKAPPKKATTPLTKSKLGTPYLLKNAGLLVASKDYLLARNVYSEVLKRDIKNRDALLGLGTCLYELGDKGAAKKCFRAGWELHDDGRAMVWLGKCASVAEEDEEALSFFERVNPSQLEVEMQFELFKERGNCRTRVGQYDEAIADYLESLKIRPNSDTVYVNLGTLSIQTGKTGEAVRFFNKAIDINRYNAKAFCGLGFIQMGQNEVKDAKRLFGKTLDLDPRNRVALLQLIAIASKSETYKEVTPYIAKYLDLVTDDQDTRFIYASILFREQRWRDCDTVLKKILEAEPGHERAQRMVKDLGEITHRSA